MRMRVAPGGWPLSNRWYLPAERAKRVQQQAPPVSKLSDSSLKATPNVSVLQEISLIDFTTIFKDKLSVLLGKCGLVVMLFLIDDVLLYHWNLLT